ncbi:polysaccharide biosynthesis/export family protein [bacterium SCSIO 12643]|nr:polysaccharide biosynthesis/export family protein [bacterium SCSIO 12643]
MRSIVVRLVIFLGLIMWFASCVPKKKMVYLQSENNEGDSVFLYERVDYKLQVNDIVDVKIVSLDEKVNKLFNSNNVSVASSAAQTANLGDLYYITGYSIDDSGYVSLPIIGKVNILDKTLEEAKREVDLHVRKYFSKYYLVLKLGGIRFSALGEFKRPGKYTILQNQATIFEAIALAGDLDMVASRSDVKIIRQYPEGTKIHKINLLDRNLIHTPYYFIQPNDVIYVEPLPAKSWGVGTNAAQSTALILSLISSTLLIIVSFSNLR